MDFAEPPSPSVRVLPRLSSRQGAADGRNARSDPTVGGGKGQPLGPPAVALPARLARSAGRTVVPVGWPGRSLPRPGRGGAAPGARNGWGQRRHALWKCGGCSYDWRWWWGVWRRPPWRRRRTPVRAVRIDGWIDHGSLRCRLTKVEIRPRGSKPGRAWEETPRLLLARAAAVEVKAAAHGAPSSPERPPPHAHPPVKGGARAARPHPRLSARHLRSRWSPSWRWPAPRLRSSPSRPPGSRTSWPSP